MQYSLTNVRQSTLYQARLGSDSEYRTEAKPALTSRSGWQCRCSPGNKCAQRPCRMVRTSQLSLGSENDDVFDLEERKEVAHRERDHPQRLFYSFLVGLEAFFGSQTGYTDGVPLLYRLVVHQKSKQKWDYAFWFEQSSSHLKSFVSLSSTTICLHYLPYLLSRRRNGLQAPIIAHIIQTEQDSFNLPTQSNS